MGSFFDDISERAAKRRNLTFEKQKTLLNSGILTPSMTNDSLDGNLTDEQIIEKNAMIEAEEQQAYNDAIGLPFGVVEGAAGILGDVELLGQGIKGAYNADRGQKWDGFVEGLQDRDTQFWTTLDNMERTDRWLEGTELGDRLKGGSGGRLVGEILAPIPVPKGVVQAGKIGAKIATHPMTRYAADTAKTEVFNAINNVNPNSIGGRGISMFTPPKQNMVIGQGSTKFDMPSYNEFKKQIDVEKVMANRKKTGKFAPTPDEQRLWEETSKRGNPTFIDADGIIKQEIPTGTMNLKAPLLKGQPQFALRNLAMNSYKGARGRGLDTQTRLAHMTDEQVNKTGASAFVNGKDISINPKLSKADFNESLAHEAQHMIQDAENLNGANWSTGSSPNLFTGRMFDEILERAEEAEEVFTKEFDKLVKAGKVTEDEYFDVMQEVTPNLFSAQVRKDALLGMRDYDNLKFGEKSKNHFYNNGDKPYFADAGELTPRVTGARAHLNKQGIADNHILNAMDEDFKGYGFTTKDMYPPDVLERFKSGQLRDQAVIDELNKTEYGQMLDDELTKFAAQDYKSFVNDYMKKLMKKKGTKLGQEYPNLKNSGFEYVGTEGKMGHGFQIHFKVGGKDYHVGSGASTPRTDVRALERTLTGLNKYFNKGSDTYMNPEKSHIIVKGDGSGGRTSYSMPNPDAKLFDDLDGGVIPKTRQNQITKLIRTPSGKEIEKPLGYRGDPMLDSNWFEEAGFTSSQTPTKDAIKYIPDNTLHNKGLAGASKPIEDLPPMNNVLDVKGNITKQPSTGLNSEAISNMNPMEAARPRGVQGFMELKEELRALYKEATGDPAMQKQIRDQIVAVDKQMNMFDPDVAKPRKSLYEYDDGQFGEQAIHESDKSGVGNIDRANRIADTDDTHFTGKYGVTDNADNISDISIQGGKTKTNLIDNPPVMNTVKHNETINSINNALKNTRATPDENINSIMRVISDLQAQAIPKLQKTRDPFLKARDEMLTYAYDAIEAIQRAAYRGSNTGNTAKVPTSTLDNIPENVSRITPPKTKPRFDNPDEYAFDEMLRSWDKEAKNIKTRERYVPNGKRLDRSKLRDHEDPVKGALPDYGQGRIKKKEFFDELEEPRTSYAMSPEQIKERNRGYSRDWAEKNKERKKEQQQKYREKNRDKLKAKSKEYTANNLEKTRQATREYATRKRKESGIVGNDTIKQGWFKELPKKTQQEFRDIRASINVYKKANKSRRGSAADEALRHTWLNKYSPTYKSNLNATEATRRAIKLERTPKGQTKADKQAIRDIYAEATRLTKETGIPHHVDHIFPLKPVKFTTRDGRNITLKQGWHEPENLTVMKGSDNISKGNRILPEQYEAILQRLNPQDKIDFMEWYRLKGFYD